MLNITTKHYFSKFTGTKEKEVLKHQQHMKVRSAGFSMQRAVIHNILLPKYY
jgi:hypothetical protein